MIDFNDANVLADPYPALATLREREPMQWSDTLQAWCVFSYVAVREALMDARLSSDRIGPFVRHAARGNSDIRYLGECIGLWMVFNDPPRHTRLRKLVNKAFLPQAIESMRPSVARQVDELIAHIKARGPGGDFVRDFAGPLPANVIAEILGVPRDDVDEIKRWSEDLARFVLTSRAEREKYAPAANALSRMNAYFAELIRRRRANPGDKIIDRLITAHDGDDLLSLEELLASCVLLMFAGHETTTHFFSSGLRALARHRDQWARLRARASDALYVKNAINEILRWDGPSLALTRVAGQDLELGGKRLTAGERVFLFIAAANRDERVFRNGEVFDIERLDAREMITFGQGIHTCLGMHLAWLEGEIAFPRLVAELDGWQVHDEALSFTGNLVVRGVKALPISPAAPCQA